MSSRFYNEDQYKQILRIIKLTGSGIEADDIRQVSVPMIDNFGNAIRDDHGAVITTNDPLDIIEREVSVLRADYDDAIHG